MQARPALAALANSAPPALAAVANAVYDVVRIRIRDLPIEARQVVGLTDVNTQLVERINIGTEGLNVRLRGHGLIGIAREMLSSDMERAA